MSENCTHDCSTCSQNCKDRTEPQSFLEKTNEYSNVKKVIAIMSGKGGVGKSFVTSALASNSAKKGKKTAVLDADITGPSIPKMFGIKGKAQGRDKYIIPMETRDGIKVISSNLLLDNETDPVIWRGPVIAGLVRQFWTDVIWDEVDCMYVDMPPGTGDVPLTVFQSIPVDGIIVVTTPQDLVGMVVEKAVNMAKMMNVPIIGIVENMSYFECPNCNERYEIFGESNVDEIAKKYNIKNVIRVPMNPEIVKKSDSGKIDEIDTKIFDEINK